MSLDDARSKPRLPLGDVTPRSTVLDERWARAAWSRLAEPEDERAHALIDRMGPIGAFEYVSTGGEHARKFRARFVQLNLDADAAGGRRAKARVVIPGDEEWPSGLDDLEFPPYCLWVRGPGSLGLAVERSVAIVGARAATGYGEQVAWELGAGMAERGFCVVSGAALGIDGAAQRAALSAGGPVVAVLAGGVDRPYPAAHCELIARIAEQGHVVSEVAPGSAPMRNRFLSRNRVIAALASATCVVEAGLRSGALSTANRALDLNRPVAAVPGPVTSMVSAGCHQLVRDGKGELVTDAAELAELAGDYGADAAARPRGPELPEDKLEGPASQVFSALPAYSGATADQLVRSSGVTIGEVLAAISEMELLGLVEAHGGGWRRSRREAPDSCRHP